VTALWWKTQRAGEPEHEPARPEVFAQPSPELRPSPGPAPVATAPACGLPEAGDATADLALDPARRSGCYAAAVDELLAKAGEVRAAWTDDQRDAFDARLATLRGDVTAAEDGRPRDRAWRAMVRYLQRAITRDEVVALASGGAP
jgi:hypothetical protein